MYDDNFNLRSLFVDAEHINLYFGTVWPAVRIWYTKVDCVLDLELFGLSNQFEFIDRITLNAYVMCVFKLIAIAMHTFFKFEFRSIFHTNCIGMRLFLVMSKMKVENIDFSNETSIHSWNTIIIYCSIFSNKSSQRPNFQYIHFRRMWYDTMSVIFYHLAIVWSFDIGGYYLYNFFCDMTKAKTIGRPRSQFVAHEKQAKETWPWTLT